METKKMSLANIKGKLSRAEMKNIMAGREDGEGTGCEGKGQEDCVLTSCTFTNPPGPGDCKWSSNQSKCICSGGH